MCRKRKKKKRRTQKNRISKDIKGKRKNNVNEKKNEENEKRSRIRRKSSDQPTIGKIEG